MTLIEKITWFWNLVHYNIFIWDKKITNFFLYPFFKLLRTSKIRDLYGKRGVTDPDLIIKDVLLNPRSEVSSIEAGGAMGILLLFICVSFFQIYTGIFETQFCTSIIPIAVCGIIVLLINYFTLFKNKRYLTYFKEFASLSNAEQYKYSWICFGFIIVVISFLIGSFIFAIYMFHHKN